MTAKTKPRTKLQQLLIDHIAKQGGTHVYLSRALSMPVDSGLSGYTWEGVNLSLKALIRRGEVRVVKDSFYYLVEPDLVANSPAPDSAAPAVPSAAAGVPVRRLHHPWPFLYSVMEGELVRNRHG